MDNPLDQDSFKTFVTSEFKIKLNSRAWIWMLCENKPCFEVEVVKISLINDGICSSFSFN